MAKHQVWHSDIEDDGQRYPQHCVVFYTPRREISEIVELINAAKTIGFNKVNTDSIAKDIDNMALRTFTIELRVDYDDKAKDELIKKAAVEAAKHLFTTALLIADKRKPLIACSGSDFFAGKEEINLAEELPPAQEDAA